VIAFVVDTNVPVVANGKSKQADSDCVIACIDKLEVIYRNGRIVLDDSMLILHEYMDNLSMSGQPGAGDAFMKWVFSVQADQSRCERVHLTEDECHPCGFLEAPNDPDLKGFDRKDRKFVAAANACKCQTQVLNAVDPDWAEYHKAFANNGIDVNFLCPQHVCPRR